MKILIHFMLFSLSFSYAQVKVFVTDPDMKLPKGKVYREKSQVSSLPSRESRDQFFSRYPESQKIISSWDELDRDFFYDDLRRLPASELSKKYSKFSPDLLQKMSKEIEK